MPVSPKDLFEVAQRLFVDNKEEKYLRTSISRAYYCAYHACRSFSFALPPVDYPSGRAPGSHQEVIDRLMLCPKDGMSETYVKSMRTVGRALQAAFDDRVKADYALNQTCSSQECNNQLIRVSRLLSQLEQAAKLKIA